MVKFFMNKGFPGRNKKRESSSNQDCSESEKQMFFIFLEYETGRNHEQNDRQEEMNPKTETYIFCAFHPAEFSGNGFLEVIHPALELHQIRCSRNQISYGIVVGVEENQDIDADYSPDFKKVVWEKNKDRYTREDLLKKISNAKSHKVRFFDSNGIDV